MFEIELTTGLHPGELILAIGNAYVSENHVGPLKEQLERLPRPFPVSLTKILIAKLYLCSLTFSITKDTEIYKSIIGTSPLLMDG